jgi:hypothetical protein
MFNFDVVMVGNVLDTKWTNITVKPKYNNNFNEIMEDVNIVK